jgi:hypothetical protein
MATYFPAELVTEVQTLMDANVGPITRWSNVLEVFLKHNIAYKVAELAPSVLMVHPENRSKLGVNPFNAHKVGAYIKRVGADFKELGNAVAFEVCALSDEKAKQVAFNQRLTQHSGGMLAPLDGSERFLTVSCGHTSQFCKAVLANCRTPYDTLADTSGCLSVDHVAKDDPKFRTMICKGWPWIVIAWKADIQWPGLADLAQRALNASNSVANQSSELEVASCIYEFAHMQSKVGDIDWAKCVSASVATAPPCHGYVAIIGEFVRKFGGGEGAPMIRYLDSFAKTYGQNKMLGEEFWKAVAETVLHPSVLQPCPHLRTALLATNLVSPKVIDGIARLLVKTDVVNLARKDYKPRVESAEHMLSECWDTVMKHVEAARLDVQKAYNLIGKLHTRSVLLLSNKAKNGPEQRVFTDMAEVQEAFNVELAQMMSTDGPLSTATSSGAASSGAAGAPDKPLLSTSDLKKPELDARDANFVVGKHYIEEKTKKLFKLISVGSKCVFKEHDLFEDVGEVEFDLEAVCSGKTFQEFKGNLPAVFAAAPSSVYNIQETPRFKEDCLKARILQILAERICNTAFEYCFNPSELRVAEHVGKGKLEMWPTTVLSNITAKRPSASTHAVEVTFKDGSTVWLTEPSRPRTHDTSSWKSETAFAPYWWVSPTSDKAAVNIVEKRVNLKDEGVSISMYTNSKPIKQHDTLFFCKVEEPAQPATAKPKPAKKAKGTA